MGEAWFKPALLFIPGESPQSAQATFCKWIGWSSEEAACQTDKTSDATG